MRLIDADALKHPNIAIFNMQLHGAVVPMVRLEDVQKHVPTVPAIPVEWLQEKMRTPCMTCANPFDYVLTEWQQEQEVQK